MTRHRSTPDNVRPIDLDTHVGPSGGAPAAPIHASHPKGRSIVAVLTALLGVATVLGMYLPATERAVSDPGVDHDQRSVDQRDGSALLHPLGGSVDTVERFISALNYGQLELARSSISPDATSIGIPVSRATPDKVARTIQIFGAIHAVIEVFGCRSTDGDHAAIAGRVSCAIAFDNDYIRAVGSGNLRATLTFQISEGRISRVAVTDLDIPVTIEAGIERLFGGRFADFLFSRS